MRIFIKNNSPAIFFFIISLSLIISPVLASPNILENTSKDTSSLENGKISFLTWPEYGYRGVYMSKVNNIAMTFGHIGIIEQYFYENFFTSNLSKPEDYFCIPDDFIFAYNQKHIFPVKAVALNWTTNHELSQDNGTAILTNLFSEQYGFNPYAQNASIAYGNSSNWRVPPLDIQVVHELTYNESFVPMIITINNTFSEPLHVIYVFQDGAWMTDYDKENQEDVHFYWDDGTLNSPRVWMIDENNRMNKNNWVGMYSDRNGGMFAGTYAPPESTCVIAHATWNIFWMMGDSPNVINRENIMEGLTGFQNVGQEPHNGHFHGTIIDFGTLDPGQERKQVLVKIMFTGYPNRTDMHKRINDIIERIPKYNLNNPCPIKNTSLGSYFEVTTGGLLEKPFFFEEKSR